MSYVWNRLAPLALWRTKKGSLRAESRPLYGVSRALAYQDLSYVPPRQFEVPAVTVIKDMPALAESLAQKILPRPGESVGETLPSWVTEIYVASESVLIQWPIEGVLWKWLPMLANRNPLKSAFELHPTWLGSAESMNAVDEGSRNFDSVTVWW